MINKSKIGKYLIIFHSFYYLFTGLWATFFLSSFEKATMHIHQGLDFKMHLIAGIMFIILSLYYLYSIKNKNWFKNRKDIIYLILGISLSIIILELLYLQRTLNFFWFDFFEELTISIFLLWLIKK